MAEPDRTNADAERVSDIVAKLRVLAGLQEYLEDEATADEAADIIEAQSKALAEAREIIADMSRAADAAYIRYTDIARIPLCCGEDAKIEAGRFGKEELNAHRRASEQLGRHRALSEFAAAARHILTPTPENPNG